MSKEVEILHNFGKDADWFIRQISSRKRVLPTFAHVGRSITERADRDLDKLIDAHATEKKYDEKGRLESYVIEEGFAKRHSIIQRTFDDYAIFSASLPKMAIVSVVSLFDAYLSKLLRNVYRAKPELLNSCTRQITFTELLEFGSIDNAREHIIEKEIETLLRDSHVAQFDWLSKRLDVKLTELDSWKVFVELTERRNLLVHADGTVSAHYLDICKRFNISVEKGVKVGDRLSISPTYYSTACNCVAEIGIKLCQVIWRKLLPGELESAETSFIDICYDLLLQHEYGLAEQVLKLSQEKAFKKVNAESGFYILINLAISLKGQEKADELRDLLRKIDFSALDVKFKLAQSVLQDRFDDAEMLMLRIGKNDDMSEANYRNWPLFRWFRKTDQFKRAFSAVFGKEFAIVKEAYFPDMTKDESDQAGSTVGPGARFEGSSEALEPENIDSNASVSNDDGSDLANPAEDVGTLTVCQCDDLTEADDAKLTA